MSPSPSPAQHQRTPAKRTAEASLLRLLHWLILAGMALLAIYYIFRSLHWALMVDSPIMHYVVFLIHHGLKPYKDISDNNMPGAYMSEAAAMWLFGATDLAWRIYEFFLLAVLALSMVVIALPEDWVAGIFAAGAFLAVHAAEGPRFAVEREEVIAVLLMLGYAAMFTAVRRRHPTLLLVMGFAGGMALSIKPTYLPLVLLLLPLMGIALRRRRIPVAPFLLYAIAGLAIAAALDFGFLLHYGVFRQFFFITRIVTPVYLGKLRPLQLIERCVPKYFVPAFLLGILSLAANLRRGERGQRSDLVERSERWGFERWALFAGAAFGLFSYFAQGKGFEHHRYPYLVFALLLTGLEALRCARSPARTRWLGVAAILSVMLFALPMYVRTLSNLNNTSVLTLQLEHDLHSLGPPAQLQDKVQCFDLVAGCLNALYHLHLVENTGFTGDLLFFRPDRSVPRDYYRAMYWRLAAKDPGTVLVIDNESFGFNAGFHKIDNWPRFRDYLDRNYTQVLARQFPTEGLSRGAPPLQPGDAPAYRIYIRNGSPLLAAALRLAQSPETGNTE